MKRALRTILSIAAVCASTTAWSQLRDCPSIGRGPDYKVVLGDVRSATPGPDVDLWRDRLAAKLKTSEEALQLEGEQRKLRTALCPGRQPVDGSEFDARTVDDLAALNVVLEIWGSVTKPSAGPSEAQLNFAMISLMKFERTQPRLVDLRFPRGTASSSDALSELMLSDGIEMRALTALTVALRFHRDGRYDVARRSYCEANVLLGKASRSANAPVAWATLRDYAGDRAGAVVRDAQADGDYRGALKLVSATTSCVPA
jgi:hypothetical protein